MKQSVSVFGLLSSPVLGVTILGMCTTRVNAAAALLGFGFGIALMLYFGVAEALCQGSAGAARCGQPGSWLVVGLVSPFWFAAVGCCATAGVGLALSASGVCGPPPPRSSVMGLTLWTRQMPVEHGGARVAQHAPRRPPRSKMLEATDASGESTAFLSASAATST